MSELRDRRHGRLFFGIAENDRWSIADPEDQALEESMRRMRYEPLESLTRDDMYRVLAAAEAYQHLIGYPLRDVSKRQFADIRRAVWARRPDPLDDEQGGE